MTIQDIFGVVSVVFAAAGYGAYIYTVLKGRTKPHVFSWAVWGVLVFIVFLAQLSKGAGAGAWATGFSAVAYFVIAGLALKRGEKHITRGDWVAFIGAICAVPVWYFTHDPLWAVLVATAIDGMAYYPTFRKTFLKPYEENYFIHLMDALKWVIAFFALSDFSLTTLVYPAFIFMADSGLAAMILWRRLRVASKDSQSL